MLRTCVCVCSSLIHILSPLTPSITVVAVFRSELFFSLSPGYFLFLRIRESNPVRGATIQSQTFPPPVSLAPCQV